MRLSSVFKKPTAPKRSPNATSQQKKVIHGAAPRTAKTGTTVKKNNKKKNARTIRVYAGYIRLFMIVLAVAMLTIIWCLGYPQKAYTNSIQQMQRLLASIGFKVQEVVVHGRINTQQQDLLKALKISRGDPIFAIDLQQARFHLEKLEWVRQATVVRRLPDLVQIKIEERRPIAIWQRNNQFYLVDEDGTAILTKDHRNYGVLPLIVGEGAPQRSPELLAMLKGFPTIQKNLQAVSRIRERRWDIYLIGGILVKLSDASLNQGLEILENLLKEQRLSVKNVNEVDLRSPERYFVKVTPETLKRIKNSRKGKLA